MADGKPVQIHTGDGKDFIYVAQSPVFAISDAGFALSLIFFLVFPISKISGDFFMSQCGLDYMI